MAENDGNPTPDQPNLESSAPGDNENTSRPNPENNSVGSRSPEASNDDAGTSRVTQNSPAEASGSNAVARHTPPASTAMTAAKEPKSAAVNKVKEMAGQGQMGDTAAKAVEAADKARKAFHVFVKVKAAFAKLVGAIVAVVTNPVFWAIAAICIVLFQVYAFSQVVGQNDNIKGCYGVGGEFNGNWDFDDGADWTGRANQTADWLMSTPFEFLGGKPMSKEQAAGVLGNFIAESGVMFARAEMKGPNANRSMDRMSNAEADAFTKAYAPAGLGLAQWTWNPGRSRDLLDVAAEQGKEWHDPTVQLTLIKKEMDGPYASRLKGAGFSEPGKSVEDYVLIFHNVYEGSADSNMNNRNKAAQEFIAQYTPGGGSATGGSCLQGAGEGVDSIVQLAILLSWPNQSQASSHGGSGKPQAKPEYIEYKEKAMNETGADGMRDLYASCDRFAATVLRNTVDKEVPWGATATQYAYFKGSSKWQEFTSKKDLKPGDVLVTRGDGHILIYIGDYQGKDSIAEASYMDRVAGITGNYLSESLSDGRQYSAFRFVG